MGVALPLYGNGSQTLHTVLPLGTRQLRRFFAARQFDVVHIHAPYNPSFFMLAPFVLPAGHDRRRHLPLRVHPGPRARPRARAHARLAEPPARPHRRLGRLHRAARPLLPGVRLARDPERHRRGSLLARRRADRRSCARAAIRSCSSSAASIPATASASCSTRSTELWRARDGHVRLCVVGDGPLRRYYAEPARARGRRMPCTGPGRVDWNRPRYYASADVFCTPCQRASFGMVLLEAMSCGRPVVASMISGLRAAAHERPRGPARRAAGRAGRLRRRARAPARLPGRAERMGAEGRVTATTRYCVEQRRRRARGATTSSCAASCRAQPALRLRARAQPHEAPAPV